jgi:hypothetical protein
VNKRLPAAFIVASLLFAGGVFTLAGQASTAATNAVPNVTSIHPHQAVSPSPSPAPY